MTQNNFISTLESIAIAVGVGAFSALYLFQHDHTGNNYNAGQEQLYALTQALNAEQQVNPANAHNIANQFGGINNLESALTGNIFLGAHPQNYFTYITAQPTPFIAPTPAQINGTQLTYLNSIHPSTQVTPEGITNEVLELDYTVYSTHNHYHGLIEEVESQNHTYTINPTLINQTLQEGTQVTLMEGGEN